jgi:hypothetical protein
MKKNILFWVLALSWVLGTLQVQACDICGCGIGNYYYGVMPQFQQNFIGLRYRQMSYRSHLGLSEHLASREYFHTTELWLRYYPHPKVQVMTMLPWHFNRHEMQGKTTHISGLGDPLLMASYQLINTTTDTVPRKVRHSLLLGGGIKLGVGAYRFAEDEANQVANANFQLGSGSNDLLINMLYTLRKGKAGLTADLNYKYNTFNSMRYRFGNRISGGASVFYIKQLHWNFALMPFAGIYGEYSLRDTRGRYTIDETGGYLLTASVGLEAYAGKRFATGFTFQQPVKQRLAAGHVEANSRFTVHTTLIF